MKDQCFHEESLETWNEDLRNLIAKETCFPILNALKFMISTSLLLALNGVMVVVFGFLLYSSTIMPSLLLAAFLVTFSVYGLNKVTDKAEDSINRPETLPRASGCYLFFSIASMLIGFLISVLEGSLAFFVLFAPVIIGVIYSIKISKSIPRLKEIVGVKSFVVALSWALSGCLLPISIGEAKLQSNVILFVYIFIRVFVGTILCDVLDKKGDLASGIETIPVRLGIGKTKKLLMIINSFEMVLLVYCVVAGIFIRFLPALLFGVLYGYLAIWYFFKNGCKRFAAGLMLDGEWFPMVLFAFLLIK